MFTVFEGGLIVDFAALPLAATRHWIDQVARDSVHDPSSKVVAGAAAAAHIMRTGVRVLLDQDGLLDHMQAVLSAVPVQPPAPPTPEHFAEAIRDFWYGPVQMVRYLRRGHWFATRGILDKPQKRCLLTMAEWHSRSQTDWQGDRLVYRDTHIERWADTRLIEALPHIFGRQDADLWDSLFALMDCYQWLSSETAANLDYPYPPIPVDAITAWVERAHQEA
jgi:hypothetical protein